MVRVFSRNVIWGGGGTAFMGRENVKDIQKNKQNLLLFGGGTLKLRVGISPH